MTARLVIAILLSSLPAAAIAQVQVHTSCGSSAQCRQFNGGVKERWAGSFKTLDECNAWLKSIRTPEGGYKGLPAGARCELTGRSETMGSADGTTAPSPLAAAMGIAALMAPEGQQLPAMAGVAAIGVLFSAFDDWSKERSAKAEHDRAVAAALKEKLEEERRRAEEERLRKLDETRNYLLNNMHAANTTGTLAPKTVDTPAFTPKTVDTATEVAPLAPMPVAPVMKPVDIEAALESGRASADLINQVPELANSPAAEQIRKGYQAAVNHDWAVAREWWERALSLDPSNTALQRSVDLARFTDEWNKSLKATVASLPAQRSAAVPAPVIARVENDDVTEAFLSEAKRACYGDTNPNCEFKYAEARKNQYPVAYLSRRNAEHYLFAKGLCEGTAPGPLDRLPRPVQGAIQAPVVVLVTGIYSVVKSTRNAMDKYSALHPLAAPADWLLVKMRWTDANPAGISPYATSPGTVNEVLWSLRGVRDCAGLKSRIPF